MCQASNSEVCLGGWLAHTTICLCPIRRHTLWNASQTWAPKGARCHLEKQWLYVIITVNIQLGKGSVRLAEMRLDLERGRETQVCLVTRWPRAWLTSPAHCWG